MPEDAPTTAPRPASTSASTSTSAGGRCSRTARRSRPTGFFFRVPLEVVREIHPWEDFELARSLVDTGTRRRRLRARSLRGRARDDGLLSPPPVDDDERRELDELTEALFGPDRAAEPPTRRRRRRFRPHPDAPAPDAPAPDAPVLEALPVEVDDDPRPAGAAGGAGGAGVLGRRAGPGATASAAPRSSGVGAILAVAAVVSASVVFSRGDTDTGTDPRPRPRPGAAPRARRAPAPPRPRRRRPPPCPRPPSPRWRSRPPPPTRAAPGGDLAAAGAPAGARAGAGAAARRATASAAGAAAGDRARRNRRPRRRRRHAAAVDQRTAPSATWPTRAGPARFTLGTPCSKPRWHAPPITSRSPPAGATSSERPPPLGRTRNGRRAPRVTMAMMRVVELAQLAIGVERDAVGAVAVVVEPERAGHLAVLGPERGADLGEERVRRRGAGGEPARQARVVEHTVVHAATSLPPLDRVERAGRAASSVPRTQCAARRPTTPASSSIRSRGGVGIDRERAGAEERALVHGHVLQAYPNSLFAMPGSGRPEGATEVDR